MKPFIKCLRDDKHYIYLNVLQIAAFGAQSLNSAQTWVILSGVPEEVIILAETVDQVAARIAEALA